MPEDIPRLRFMLNHPDNTLSCVAKCSVYVDSHAENSGTIVKLREDVLKQADAS